MEDGYGIAFGIELAAYSIMVVAACLGGLALARAAEVRLVRPLPRRALPRLVVLLGVAGAVVMAIHAHRLWANEWDWYVAPYVWGAGMALVVPAWAATAAVPRRFGASLLTGWAGGGVATMIYDSLLLAHLRSEGNSDIGGELIIIFGVISLALVALAVPLARADRASQVERTT
jgi:hypothetical protein